MGGLKLMHVYSIGKKHSLVLAIFIWTDIIFKYFVNLNRQNNVKSAIMNLIQTKLHRIHGRIVVNSCVENREELFISVGDIHPDGQHFQIFCQFEQTKMAIRRQF